MTTEIATTEPTANLVGREVAVLVIEYRHGDTASAHTSQEAAHAALVAYVDSQWGNEMKGEPMPEDDDEMVDAYFDAVEDEHYSINTYKIES